MAEHGKRRRYNQGCRCDDCKAANRAYQQDYQARRAAGAVDATVVALSTVQTPGPGPVEAGVEVEIAGLAQTEARPGLAATALELARVMDNPNATNQKAPASKALAEILGQLRKGADARKSKLASVRAMTSSKAAG